MSPVQLDIRDAFAAYRLPHQKDHFLISGALVKSVPKSGAFIIEGFDKSGADTTSYIVAEDIKINSSFRIITDTHCDLKSTDQSAYLHMADAAIRALKLGQLEKVVLSKIKIANREDQDIFQLFAALKDLYPSAFVFLYNVPGDGLWCGATPEVLITADDHHVATTMALAGTQKDKGLPLDQVVWGQKEIHEQKIIEEYIAQKLENLNITYTKKGPETSRAGQVLHLRSDITMKDIDDPMLIANVLHPGPAICGRPQETAMEWILDHEQHDRAHYCGFIGPWNINSVRSLYVNLRSMCIFKNAYVLYLGGGLTKDSIAVDEWQETELKAQTMLAVINKNVIHE